MCVCSSYCKFYLYAMCVHIILINKSVIVVRKQIRSSPVNWKRWENLTKRKCFMLNDRWELSRLSTMRRAFQVKETAISQKQENNWQFKKLRISLCCFRKDVNWKCEKMKIEKSTRTWLQKPVFQRGTVKHFYYENNMIYIQGR